MTDLEDIFDPPPAPPQVDLGTAGWDDREDHFEKGTAQDDGHTFIFVTLYRGRDPSRRPKKGLAAGYKIRALLADGVAIPKKGARCYVLMPPGMEQVAGAGVVTCTVTPGLERFTNLGDNAKTMTSPNGVAAFVLNDSGTIAARTKTPEGYDAYWRLAPDSWKFVAPWGTMRCDLNGWAWGAAGGATMNMGAMALPAPFDQLGSWFRVQAAAVTFKCSTARFGIGPSDKLVKSTPLNVALAAIDSAMVDLNGAITTAIGATGAPGSATAATGFTAAAATIMATLGTALTTAADAIKAIVASE